MCRCFATSLRPSFYDAGRKQSLLIMEDLKTVFKWLLLLLMLSLYILLFGACSSRKSSVNHSIDKVKTEVKSTVDNDITTNKQTTIVVNDETNEIEVSPIDTAKVLVINGQTYKNAKVRLVKRKTKTDVSKIETTKDLSKSQTRAETTHENATRVKDSKRINFSLKWLWLLLIPVGFYIFFKLKTKLI